MKKLLALVILALGLTSLQAQGMSWLYARDDAYVSIYTLGYQAGVRAAYEVWLKAGQYDTPTWGLVLRAVASEDIYKLSGELRVTGPYLSADKWYLSPWGERTLELMNRQ